MRRHNTLHAFLLITLFTLQCCVPSSTAGCSGSSSAVLSALLPLHAGEDCSQLQLRGLQQLAALRAVVSDVNNELKAQDGLTIGLLVQDTCSSPEGAMKAALRTLVDIQQTCSNPPLYLGMVGPEDSDSLSKVKAVSRVFNATHVVPFFHSVAKESEEDSVFYVSMERLKEQAQSLLAIVKKLNWQSFSLAFEEPMSELAEILIHAVKEDSSVCVKGSVSRMHVQAAVPNIFGGSQDGVVVLADSHQMAAKVLQSYQALTTPLILMVRTAGLEAWQVPRSASKMYLMQQISASDENVPQTLNTTLMSQYEAQKQAEFKIHCKDITNAADCAVESNTQDALLENIDVSATGMANAVRLIGSALRTSHRARCLAGSSPVFGMCAKLLALPSGEWHSALRRATATTKQPDNTRVRFLMELPTSFSIYSRDNNEGNLVKVASLTAGTLKQLAGYNFPAMQHAANLTSCGETPKIPIAPPPIVIAAPPPAGEYTEGPTLRDLYTSEYSFYELVGMICGVGFIMFGVMVVIIYVIYNNLVEKTEKESTGGSLESVPARAARPTTRDRASRAARGLRDTFRRNSSVRSSTHS
ncbi:uncharacterized protein LOC128993356 [Macrosteles quadrilineatus]|uniref:uncharacterized protein LOC128993356 n=1 Tax=Macrosteles quadrilineatus TaxID=74068 RepID=UPI0023E27553|nr:uncharacterized protein LOC128993356 [Macrosteles quadrilineatus]